MTATQSKIASRLRYCWNHCDSRAEDLIVAWVAEHLADELYGATRAPADRAAFLEAAIGNGKARD